MSHMLPQARSLLRFDRRDWGVRPLLPHGPHKGPSRSLSPHSI
jgi:hypothetical protein